MHGSTEVERGHRGGPTCLDAGDLAVSLKQGPDLALGHARPAAKCHAGDKDARELHRLPVTNPLHTSWASPASSFREQEPQYLASPATEEQVQATNRTRSASEKLVESYGLRLQGRAQGGKGFHLHHTTRTPVHRGGRGGGGFLYQIKGHELR